MDDSSAYNNFYLNHYKELKQQLLFLEKEKIPVVLIGASFALLNFVEKYGDSLQF